MIIPNRLESALLGGWGECAMIKKSLSEELCIHIDHEELAQLLGADPGFSVQNVEGRKGAIAFC